MKTSKNPVNMLIRALTELGQQKEWVAEHGATLAGYIAVYGEHGENIFNADMAELQRLENRVAQATGMFHVKHNDA